MALLSESEHRFAAALARLSHCNHFLPERIDCERQALGDEFIAGESVWNVRPNVEGERPNIVRLHQRAEETAAAVRQRLAAGQRGGDQEIDLYQDLVLYLLYHRVNEKFSGLIVGPDERTAGRRIEFYRDFARDFAHFMDIPGHSVRPRYPVPHLFASAFQIRRAFHFIFRYIVGASMPAARLRAAVWQSIFTADMKRYQRILYDRMGDFMTMIVGPSGTGKELVARAVALSRYIPFDEKTQSFTEEFAGCFHPLNLSALSPTLIESELFGHRRGAFTGALEDRAGWLEVCTPLGTVFLDEAGEIDPAIQVKLLRVLQTRTFQRLGDTQTRPFRGKIIAATNRDLAREMQTGRMRQDFYYRLCSDMITTPSLREILADSPTELRNLVLYIARHVLRSPGGADDGAAEEAEPLAEQVVGWIDGHLGPGYLWPGNFRELEQCVRNILIRGEYRPPHAGATEDLADAVRAGTLTAEQLLQRYCRLVYAQTGSYEATARRVELDRRTVKAKVEAEE